MKTLQVDQVSDGLDCTIVPAIQKWVYKVIKVTNSVTPKILDNLTVDQLDGYCESDDWEVTIK